MDKEKKKAIICIIFSTIMVVANIILYETKIKYTISGSTVIFVFIIIDNIIYLIRNKNKEREDTKNEKQ